MRLQFAVQTTCATGRAIASRKPKQKEMAKIGNHAVVEGYAGLTQIAHSPEPAQTKNEPNAGPNAIGASGLRWSVQRHALRYAAMQKPLNSA